MDKMSRVADSSRHAPCSAHLYDPRRDRNTQARAATLALSAFAVATAHVAIADSRGLHRYCEDVSAMHAMVLNKLGAALEWTELADRRPGPGEIRVKIAACGVCRTDLHVVDGELADPKVPIIPGHEIVGRIDALGAGVEELRIDERVGIPWLGHTCGVCPYCVRHRDNLCDRFTGAAVLVPVADAGESGAV